MSATEAGSGAKAVFPAFEPSIFLGQIFWISLCFGVLYFVMARYGLPKVAQIIDERSERIRRDREAALKFNAQSDEAMAAYETLLEDSRAEARAILKARRDEATSRLNDHIHEQEVLLKSKLDEAVARIERERLAAIEEAKAASVEIAHEIYVSIVGKAPSNKDLEKAVSGQFN